MNGHISVLQWLIENRYTCLDAQICAYAAMNGQLELMKWARQNDCPWDMWTCTYAQVWDHRDILQWARENGCPYDGVTSTVGQLKALRLIVEHGGL
jgi:hypothetical protein